MRIIFAGTPQFAAIALEALLQSENQVVAVFTQPDRPAGRGLKLAASPVKALAEKHNILVYQPSSLKNEAEEALLASFKADVMVVAAYSMLLPAKVLSIPRLGCINIHPSLLPRWRGAAPIPRSIAAGDTMSGVTIMQMDQGLDTGPILFQRQYVLEPDETAQSLHDQLAILGAECLLETLERLAQGTIIARAQDNQFATYAHKISKQEALLDWSRPAIELEHDIRAFNPWPVCYTSWRGQNLRIWAAKAVAKDHQSASRTILRATKDAIEIATGKGVLRLLRLQLPGGKVLSATDFYNAKHAELVIGEHFI